jgi:hypothetical protein
MILAALAGASLVVTVAIDSGLDAGRGADAPVSLAQKNIAVQPLVRSATECVAQSVLANPRFGATAQAVEINELIVESMTPCAAAMRAMIDAYDRYFGAGTGQTFFMGPYLDILPAAVHSVVKGAGRASRGE